MKKPWNCVGCNIAGLGLRPNRDRTSCLLGLVRLLPSLVLYAIWVGITFAPMLSFGAVTALSFRNGNLSGSSIISSIEAGQAVYLRADAGGINGQTISVELWEDDGIGDDL